MLRAILWNSRELPVRNALIEIIPYSPYVLIFGKRDTLTQAAAGGSQVQVQPPRLLTVRQSELRTKGIKER